MINLKLLRREWIAKTKAMTGDELIEYMGSFMDKVYYYKDSGSLRIVEIVDEFHDPENNIFKAKFIIESVLTRTNQKNIPPWHVLAMKETKEKEIPTESDIQIYQKCCLTIWDKWNSYINTEGESTNKEVEYAKNKITNDYCPYYQWSIGWKLWHEALDTMARKMHSSYIPITKKHKEPWSAS